MRYYVEWGGRTRELEIVTEGETTQVLVDGKAHTVDVAATGQGGLLSLIVDGQSLTYGARFEDGAAVLSFHDREVRVPVEDERERQTRLMTGGGRKAAGAAKIKSVMPGVVKELRVAPGERVAEGAPLLILEAMKMENEIRAPQAGVVEAVHVTAGQAVEKGAPLVDIGPLPAEASAPDDEAANAPAVTA